MTIRFLWKTFGPRIIRWLGKKAMQKVQKSFEQRMGSTGQQQNTAHQSTKSTSNNRQFREKKKVGEYVDFEEID